MSAAIRPLPDDQQKDGGIKGLAVYQYRGTTMVGTPERPDESKTFTPPFSCTRMLTPGASIRTAAFGSGAGGDGLLQPASPTSASNRKRRMCAFWSMKENNLHNVVSSR